MAILKECPKCKKQSSAISFANGICGDCIQILLAQRLAQSLKIKQNQIEEDIIVYGGTPYDPPACSSCGKKHINLDGPKADKCDDCRKLEAKVYDCLFCEDQEPLFDLRENERWIYGMNCVCLRCASKYFGGLIAYLDAFKTQISGEIKSKYWDAAGTYRFEKVKVSSLYSRGQSMLYLHYEEFQISLPDKGVQNLVRLVFSISATEKKVYGAKVFATIKDCVYYLKQIPGDSRTMDPKTYIWTIPQDKFDSLKKIYLTMQFISSEAYFKKHDSLQDFVDGVKKQKLGDIPKAEEFFYSYGQPTAQATLSKESIASKLELILIQALGEPVDLAKASAIELLKIYRHAALKLHPDRNGGDGSR